MDLLRSLPLGLYLEQPVTWLHRLDSRVKLGWLLSFLLMPVLANPAWRLLLVGVLILITLTALIPWRVWQQQIGWLLFLCGLVFFITAIAPDGLSVDHRPRLPEPHSMTVSLAPTPKTSYQYVLVDQGLIKINRRSLDLAIRASTLLFTLIYSTNLFLLTTAAEEITAGIEELLQPLRRLHWPITEISLTLTLSLRFIPLVLEEIQNLVRSIWTRAINWRQLGLRYSVQLWLLVAERLLENLLLRAEQIATAMQVRGFTSPNRHRVDWHELCFKFGDWAALVVLGFLWGLRLGWGGII